MEFNREKIHNLIWLGWDNRDWYPETFQTLTNLFGSNASLFADLLAATSINTSLKGNVRLARRAYWERLNGKPHVHYLPNIRNQLELLANGKPLSGRKISNYASAIKGDPNAVVVDVWILRAFDLAKTKDVATRKNYTPSPTNKQYDFIEGCIKYIATHAYLEPRQVQAAIWSGVRLKETGDRVDRYDDVLKQQEFNMYD